MVQERGKQDWRRPRGFRMTPEKWKVVEILAKAHLDALGQAGELPVLMFESVERSMADVASSYGIHTDVFWDAVHRREG